MSTPITSTALHFPSDATKHLGIPVEIKVRNFINLTEFQTSLQITADPDSLIMAYQQPNDIDFDTWYWSSRSRAGVMAGDLPVPRFGGGEDPPSEYGLPFKTNNLPGFGAGYVFTYDDSNDELKYTWPNGYISITGSQTSWNQSFVSVSWRSPSGSGVTLPDGTTILTVSLARR